MADTEQKLPAGATYGSSRAPSDSDQQLPEGASYASSGSTVSNSSKPLPEGAQYGQPRQVTQDTTSPAPSGHVLHRYGEGLWTGVGNMASAAYDALRDVVSRKTPLIIPDEDKKPWDPSADTLVNKYLTGPSLAEAKRADEEADAFKKSTNPYEAFGHGLNTYIHTAGEYIPLVGPIAGHLVDKAESGDIAGAAGEATVYGVIPKVAEKATIPLVKGTLKRVPLIREIPDLLEESRENRKADLIREATEPKPLFPGDLKGPTRTPDLAEQEQAIKAAKNPYAYPLGRTVKGLWNKFQTSSDSIRPSAEPVQLPWEENTHEPNKTSGGSPPEGAINPFDNTPQQAPSSAEESPKTIQPIKEPSSQVQNLIERGLGNEPEPRLSSDPRKATLQQAGATPEELKTILSRGSKYDPTSKVGLSKLAEHFGVNLGQSAIGRGNLDIAAGTHIAPADVLQKIIDAGHSPTDIAQAVEEGKHLPTVKGGSPKEFVHPEEVNAEAANFLKQLGNPEVPQIETSGLPDEHTINIGGRSQTLRNPYALQGADFDPQDLAQKYLHRLSAKYDFRNEPGSLLTRRIVEATSPTGESMAKVVALSDNANPNEWTVRISDAKQEGTGIGTESYVELFKNAQEEADRTGEPVTVNGDGYQTAAAKAVWKKLNDRGFDVVYKGLRPSVTFEPYSFEAPTGGSGKLSDLLWKNDEGFAKIPGTGEEKPEWRAKRGQAVRKPNYKPVSLPNREQLPAQRPPVDDFDTGSKTNTYYTEPSTQPYKPLTVPKANRLNAPLGSEQGTPIQDWDLLRRIPEGKLEEVIGQSGPFGSNGLTKQHVADLALRLKSQSPFFGMDKDEIKKMIYDMPEEERTTLKRRITNNNNLRDLFNEAEEEIKEDRDAIKRRKIELGILREPK